MFIFFNAAFHVVAFSGEAFLLKGAKCLKDRVIVEMHFRVAIGFLIAGIDERVERERIVFGRGNFLFDQRAENAGFDIRQGIGHVLMIHGGL